MKILYSIFFFLSIFNVNAQCIYDIYVCDRSAGVEYGNLLSHCLLSRDGGIVTLDAAIQMDEYQSVDDFFITIDSAINDWASIINYSIKDCRLYLMLKLESNNNDSCRFATLHLGKRPFYIIQNGFNTLPLLKTISPKSTEGYFDLGIVPSSSMFVEMCATMNTVKGCNPFGARISSSSTDQYGFHIYDSGLVTCMIGNKATNKDAKILDQPKIVNNVPFCIQMNDECAYLDGIRLDYRGADDYVQGNLPMWLFCVNESGVPKKGTGQEMKLGSFCIIDNDIITHLFLPAKENGCVCLYDIINDTILFSTAPEDFIDETFEKSDIFIDGTIIAESNNETEESEDCIGSLTISIRDNGKISKAKTRYIIDSDSHEIVISFGKDNKVLLFSENNNYYPIFRKVNIGCASVDIIQQGQSTIDIKEFVETDGKTYFDLGVVPDSLMNFEIKGARSNSVKATFFGSRTSSKSLDQVQLYFHGDGKGVNWYNGQRQTNAKNSPKLPSLFDVFETSLTNSHCHWMSNEGQIFNYEMSQNEEKFTKSTLPLYLFALNQDSTAISFCEDGTRLYYFKIFEDSTLIHYYVPIVSGLYDLVTNDFLYPSGEGNIRCNEKKMLYDGLITIIEDDGRARIIDDGITELYESYGILPTLAICPGQIFADTEDNRMSRNFFTGSKGTVFPVFSFKDLEILVNKGYDLQDHSWSHADNRFVWYTDSSGYYYNGIYYDSVAGPSWWPDSLGEKYNHYFGEGGPWNIFGNGNELNKTNGDTIFEEACQLAVEQELILSKEWFIKNFGFYNQDVFVSPNNVVSYNNIIHNLGYRFITSSTQNKAFQTSYYETTCNRGKTIKNINRFYLSDSSISECITAINRAKDNNKWIVLLIHSVSPAQNGGLTNGGDHNMAAPKIEDCYGGTNKDGCPSVSYSTYEKLLQEILSSGIKYASFHDAITKYDLAQ